MLPLKKESEVELPLEEDDKEEIFILKKEQGSTLSKCESRKMGSLVFFKEQRLVVSSSNWRRRRDFISRFR